jgi:hypothetical protein
VAAACLEPANAPSARIRQSKEAGGSVQSKQDLSPRYCSTSTQQQKEHGISKHAGLRNPPGEPYHPLARDYLDACHSSCSRTKASGANGLQAKTERQEDVCKNREQNPNPFGTCPRESPMPRSGSPKLNRPVETAHSVQQHDGCHVERAAGRNEASFAGYVPDNQEAKRPAIDKASFRSDSELDTDALTLPAVGTSKDQAMDAPCALRPSSPVHSASPRCMQQSMCTQHAGQSCALISPRDSGKSQPGGSETTAKRIPLKLDCPAQPAEQAGRTSAALDLLSAPSACSSDQTTVPRGSITSAEAEQRAHSSDSSVQIDPAPGMETAAAEAKLISLCGEEPTGEPPQATALIILDDELLASASGCAADGTGSASRDAACAFEEHLVNRLLSFESPGLCSDGLNDAFGCHGSQEDRSSGMQVEEGSGPKKGTVQSSDRKEESEQGSAEFLCIDEPYIGGKDNAHVLSLAVGARIADCRRKQEGEAVPQTGAAVKGSDDESTANSSQSLGDVTDGDLLSSTSRPCVAAESACSQAQAWSEGSANPHSVLPGKHLASKAKQGIPGAVEEPASDTTVESQVKSSLELSKACTPLLTPPPVTASFDGQDISSSVQSSTKGHAAGLIADDARALKARNACTGCSASNDACLLQDEAPDSHEHACTPQDTKDSPGPTAMPYPRHSQSGESCQTPRSPPNVLYFPALQCTNGGGSGLLEENLQPPEAGMLDGEVHNVPLKQHSWVPFVLPAGFWVPEGATVATGWHAPAITSYPRVGRMPTPTGTHVFTVTTPNSVDCAFLALKASESLNLSTPGRHTQFNV